MMKIFISILCFLVFAKLLIFWVWLWQLKEYHWGRFKAHFETQKIKKLFFSFHGIRYPKLTQKVFVILTFGILFEFLFLFFIFNLTNYLFYVFLLISIILVPIIVSILILLLQILVNILIKGILKKAEQKRKEFKNLIVIGITGSYGKSSTKEFLAIILFEKYNVLKTKKNINAEIGIAKTILNELKPEHQVFIAEIGAYEIGKIKQIAQMIKPKIGILTGINEQHLSTFGSQENIRKAKYELIENLPKNGVAIIKDKLDIQAEDIRIEKEYFLFRIGSVDFKVNLLGKHNIQNILLAVSCAKKLGMSLEEISKTCLKIKPEQGGIKFLRKNGLTVLDASYSANPAGVIADLNYLKIYSGKKVIVMPCLIELGKASKQIHKRICRKIGEVCDLAIITTKDYFKEIKGENKNIFLIENPKNIVVKLKEFCGPNDVILLEGRVPKTVIDLLRDDKKQI